MLVEKIQAELLRLQLHPVNLAVSAGEQGDILLKGSLLAHWDVPRTIKGEWFLTMLRGLPDVAGPQATMDAFFAAYAQQAQAG